MVQERVSTLDLQHDALAAEDAGENELIELPSDTAFAEAVNGWKEDAAAPVIGALERIADLVLDRRRDHDCAEGNTCVPTLALIRG